MVTPSLTILGEPNLASSTTLRPWGKGGWVGNVGRKVGSRRRQKASCETVAGVCGCCSVKGLVGSDGLGSVIAPRVSAKRTDMLGRLVSSLSNVNVSDN